MTTRVSIGADGAIDVAPAMRNAVELWTSLRAEFFAIGRAALVDVDGTRYPALQRAELRSLVGIWNQAIARAAAPWVLPGWLAYLGTIADALAAGDRAADFPGAGEFWRRTGALAEALDGLADRWRESEVIDRLRRGVSRAGQIVGAGGIGIGPTLIASGAERASAVVERAAGGVWRAVRIPLLLGAVVLGAVVVVPRLLPPHDRTVG